jgi:hypothetical protein
MCAIHVALSLLTGSVAMSVFQTLSAGNIWHFGAPGMGGPVKAAVGVGDGALVAPAAAGTRPSARAAHETAVAQRNRDERRDTTDLSIFAISAFLVCS